MNDRLSASDMSSLLAERGPIHVHVGATIVVAGKPPEFERLVGHVESRLGLIPRFRQRITSVGAIALDNPVWADDSGFDIERHVRRVALPQPGRRRELRELVGRVMSEPLDLTRPLWQLYLVEGLEGKRHAYISKTHHALVDGVAAVDVGTIILDASPEGTEMEVTAERWEPDEPSPELLFVRDASDRIRAPLRAARKAARAALTMPRSTAGRVMRTAEGFARLAASGPTAPRTFLNQEIGRDRRVAFVDDRARAAQGDARRFGRDRQRRDPRDRGRRPAAAVRAARRRGPRSSWSRLVPMSIRRPGEDLELGNRIATLLVRLPIAEPDPGDPTGPHPRRDNPAEGLRAGNRRVADHRGDRVDAADDQPRPRRRDRAAARLQPGGLQRPRPAGAVLSARQPARGDLPIRAALAAEPRALDRRAQLRRRVFFGLAGDRDVFDDIDELATDLEAALDEQAAAVS